MFKHKTMTPVEKSIRMRRFYARNRRVRGFVYKFYITSAISLFSLILCLGVVEAVYDLIWSQTPVMHVKAQIRGIQQEPTVQEWVFNRLREKLPLNEALRGMQIVQCESQWRPDIIMMNDSTVDVGLWQINSIHKDISNADKLDYKKATDWAIDKRLKDTNWSAWVCNRKV